MIEVNLHLEHAAEAQRSATAWLISGDDPLRWLDEIAVWKLDEQKLTLFIIPKSPTDPAPGGVLVTTAGQRATPARVPAGLAFAAAAEGFYVPVESRLTPALTEAELKALKQREVVVFHPALGPLEFSLAEALGVWDLLALPREHEPQWAPAPVEITPHPRIEAIGFRVQPSLEDLFGPEAADIGADSPNDLPPVEGEPPSGMIGRGLKKLRDSLGKQGQGSSKAGAFQQIQQWISANVQGAARDLALARSRAMMRLLDQLEKNPDEGLKRALPLGGSGQHRGIAPPAGDLGSRSADFSLDRLRGGRAADFWHVPPDLMQQLRLRYLELAERERQLGRYRRAAYIYAELLGDMLGAARVLVEGMHWREAALLYRDYLARPMEAAKCFVEARMIPEAVELYEKAAAYEQLGELYRKLGEEQKATVATRAWVAQLLARSKRLQAAEILEQKLAARDEALQLLEATPVRDPEGRLCLQRAFAMRGANGEHEGTATLVRKLDRDVSSDRTLTLPVVELFGSLQTSYPDRVVRALAEDLGRQQIAWGLTQTAPLYASSADVLRALPTLAPDDRLLARDAQRYFDRQKPKAEPLPSVSKAQPGAVIPIGTHPARLELLREFHLPSSRVQWMKAAPTAQGFCVIGSGRSGAELVRCTYEGGTQTVRWHGSELPDQTVPEFLLCTAPGGQERIFAAAIHAPPLSEHEMPETNLFSKARAGGPNWLAEPVSAAAFAADRTLWVLRATSSGAVVSGFQENGQFVATFSAPPIHLASAGKEQPPRMPRIHLAAAGQEVLCAVGNSVHRCAAPGATAAQVIEFEEAVTGLEASPLWGAPHVAILLESRIAICWLGVHRGRVHVIDAHAEGAIAGFTSDRTLVALTRDSGILLDSDSRGRVRSARFGWRGAAPLAVLRGPAARTFTVIDVNGLVRIFRFSPTDLR